jgi:hypothetical protein
VAVDGTGVSRKVTAQPRVAPASQCAATAPDPKGRRAAIAAAVMAGERTDPRSPDRLESSRWESFA